MIEVVTETAYCLCKLISACGLLTDFMGLICFIFAVPGGVTGPGKFFCVLFLIWF